MYNLLRRILFPSSEDPSSNNTNSQSNDTLRIPTFKPEIKQTSRAIATEESLISGDIMAITPTTRNAKRGLPTEAAAKYNTKRAKSSNRPLIQEPYLEQAEKYCKDKRHGKCQAPNCAGYEFYQACKQVDAEKFGYNRRLYYHKTLHCARTWSSPVSRLIPEEMVKAVDAWEKEMSHSSLAAELDITEDVLSTNLNEVSSSKSKRASCSTLGLSIEPENPSGIRRIFDQINGGQMLSDSVIDPALRGDGGQESNNPWSFKQISHPSSPILLSPDTVLVQSNRIIDCPGEDNQVASESVGSAEDPAAVLEANSSHGSEQTRAQSDKTIDTKAFEDYQKKAKRYQDDSSDFFKYQEDTIKNLFIYLRNKDTVVEDIRREADLQSDALREALNNARKFDELKLQIASLNDLLEAKNQAILSAHERIASINEICDVLQAENSQYLVALDVSKKENNETKKSAIKFENEVARLRGENEQLQNKVIAKVIGAIQALGQ